MRAKTDFFVRFFDGVQCWLDVGNALQQIPGGLCENTLESNRFRQNKRKPESGNVENGNFITNAQATTACLPLLALYVWKWCTVSEKTRCRQPKHRLTSIMALHACATVTHVCRRSSAIVSACHQFWFWRSLSVTAIFAVSGFKLADAYNRQCNESAKSNFLRCTQARHYRR